MSAPIYRDYDRDELDRQLNLRARWPEHPKYFAIWADASAVARTTLGGRLDLAYGPSAGQRLDLFLPTRPTAGGAPLLAFIHGGYWQGLDKSDFSYLAPPFVDAGIAFASLNYDLAPHVTIGEIVRQVRRAMAWLHDNAAVQNLDAARIFVAGHSAGGHLAAMALQTDWRAEGALPADLVKGACSISGVYDLEPIRLSYHQAVVRLDEATVASASPVRVLPAQAGLVICAVGAGETEEFLQQQEEFLAAWRARGLNGASVPLPGRNHFTAVEALGEADHPLFRAVKALILEGKLPLQPGGGAAGSA